eukprot:5577912-Lingulodinium_polyedra.AAC.1
MIPPLRLLSANAGLAAPPSPDRPAARRWARAAHYAPPLPSSRAAPWPQTAQRHGSAATGTHSALPL